ncbi:MAG: hypothetical protein K2Y32_08510 [Candidatus Obscuribacterales bacterium]|nr:hypothetical protein [Candidatus Obscuribacterales bacterium]
MKNQLYPAESAHLQILRSVLRIELQNAKNAKKPLVYLLALSLRESEISGPGTPQFGFYSMVLF